MLYFWLHDLYAFVLCRTTKVRALSEATVLMSVCLLSHAHSAKAVHFRAMLIIEQLESGPMPNVMAALPNIGGALCSTPQSLADAHYYSAVR